jgi:hypothetical protein
VRNVTAFLCDVISPEEINPKMLEQMDHECARRLAGADLFNTAIDLLKKGVVECVAEAWAAAVQIMYLGTSTGLHHSQLIIFHVFYSFVVLTYSFSSHFCTPFLFIVSHFQYVQ